MTRCADTGGPQKVVDKRSADLPQVFGVGAILDTLEAVGVALGGPAEHQLTLSER